MCAKKCTPVKSSLGLYACVYLYLYILILWGGGFWDSGGVVIKQPKSSCNGITHSGGGGPERAVGKRERMSEKEGVREFLR